MTAQKVSCSWSGKANMFNWRELSKGCVKGLLITLNVLCILTALWTFCYAVVDTKILKQYGEKRAEGSLIGDLIIIAVCVVLASIAVLGCIGTVLGKVKILYTYIISIMILVLFEVLVAIFVSVKRYGLQYRVSEWLQEDFYSNATRTAEEERIHEKFWDALQSDYSCCGLNGPEDYAAINRAVSVSCCEKAYKAKTATAQRIMYQACMESASYFTDGCEDELLDALTEGAEAFLGVVIISFWFEAMGMLLAMWIANHIKNSVQVYKNTVKY